MKLLHATVAVALMRLVVATLAVAQPGVDVAAAPIPARVELGGSAGLTVGFPEVGLLASLPAGRRASVELAASYMPEHWESPERQLAQIQVRVPFRQYLRSRRSWTAGVTRIIALADGDRPFLDRDAMLLPHAGVSLQWPLSRHADFRFDGQGVLTFASEVPLVPRASVVLVWHPGS